MRRTDGWVFAPVSLVLFLGALAVGSKKAKDTLPLVRAVHRFVY